MPNYIGPPNAALLGYDPTTGLYVPLAIGGIQFASSGEEYGVLQTTGGGGGTQYTDGQTPPANPIGGSILFDNSGVWVDVGIDHPYPVFVSNAIAIGQQLTINSTSIVPASDSPDFPVKLDGVWLFTTAQNAVGTGNSADFNVAGKTEVAIDINVTASAGTNPTIQFIYSRKGFDGIYYPLWQSAVFTPAMLSSQNNKVQTSIGRGTSYNQSLGLTGQLGWIVGGTVTPTFTFTPNVAGK